MGFLTRIKSRSQGDLKRSKSTDPSAPPPAVPRGLQGTSDDAVARKHHQTLPYSNANGAPGARAALGSSRADQIVTPTARDGQHFSSRAVPTHPVPIQTHVHAPSMSTNRARLSSATNGGLDARLSTFSNHSQGNGAGRHSPLLTSSPQLSLHSHSDEHEQEIMSDEWRSVLIGAKPKPPSQDPKRESMNSSAERARSRTSSPGLDFVARPPRRSSLLAKDLDLGAFSVAPQERNQQSSDPTPTSSAATTPKPALVPLQSIAQSKDALPAFAVLSPSQTFFGGSPTLSQSSRFTPEVVSPNLSANSLTSSITNESTTPHTPPIAGNAAFSPYHNSNDSLDNHSRSQQSGGDSAHTLPTLTRSPKLTSAEVDEARQSLQRLDASFGNSSDSSSSFSRLSPGVRSNGPSPTQNSPSSVQSPLSSSEIAKFHLPSAKQSQISLERQSRHNEPDRSSSQRTPTARSSAQFKATVSPPSPRVPLISEQGQASRPPPINTNVQRYSAHSSPYTIKSPMSPHSLRSQFEKALIVHADQILSRVLVDLDYQDTVMLRTVSKTLKQCIEVDAKELVLQRFLNHFGYRTIRIGSKPPSPHTATTPVNPHRASSLAASSPTSFRSSMLQSPAQPLRLADPVPLNLRDLDVFLMGHATPAEHYAMFARDYNQDRLHSSTLRLARASTRAWNRVVARIRSQHAIHPASLWSPMYARLVPTPAPDMQVFKPGRAPVFRVWVPTGQGHGAEWMTTEELIECEREIWRSGVWNELRKGDVIANVAISRLGNLGRVIFDGKYLRDFMFKFDMVGHLPNWLQSLCFPPAFYHNVVATSTPTPIVYLGLGAFVNQLRSTLTLEESQIPVSSPQGRYLVKTFVYRGTINIRPGTIVGFSGTTGSAEIVHDDWCGKLIIETDGTNEHAALLIARASAHELMPYRIIRERSRPGQLWIRPVMDNEAIA
ncbi:hypothetical protein OIV83_001620 [Microbotryomycetes sp. JL201]|nr:hypothetical protein OIV83_001620 [Microbotryomycetes sp. JL201]